MDRKSKNLINLTKKTNDGDIIRLVSILDIDDVLGQVDL